MLNRIVLIGRLTRDPDSQYTPSGTAITKFSIAVDRDFKNKETGEKETDFFDVVTFRQTAEFVSKYVTKGRLVSVDGRLQTRKYVSRDGVNKTAFDIQADNVHALDKGADAGNGDAYAQPAAVAPVATASNDNEDPFADSPDEPAATGW